MSFCYFKASITYGDKTAINLMIVPLTITCLLFLFSFSDSQHLWNINIFSVYIEWDSVCVFILIKFHWPSEHSDQCLSSYLGNLHLICVFYLYLKGSQERESKRNRLRARPRKRRATESSHPPVLSPNACEDGVDQGRSQDRECNLGSQLKSQESRYFNFYDACQDLHWW